MKQRDLDGCYFRVERDGKFYDLCFTDLTTEERNSVLDRRTSEWLKNLCLHLAQCLRRIGDDLGVEREWNE